MVGSHLSSGQAPSRTCLQEDRPPGGQASRRTGLQEDRPPGGHASRRTRLQGGHFSRRTFLQLVNFTGASCRTSLQLKASRRTALQLSASRRTGLQLKNALVSNARDLEEAHDHPQWGESTQLLTMQRVLWPSW